MVAVVVAAVGAIVALLVSNGDSASPPATAESTEPAELLYCGTMDFYLQLADGLQHQMGASVNAHTTCRFAQNLAAELSRQSTIGDAIAVSSVTGESSLMSCATQEGGMSVSCYGGTNALVLFHA